MTDRSPAHPRLCVVVTTTRGDITLVAPVKAVQITMDVSADGLAHPKQSVRLRSLPSDDPRNGCALTFPTPESLFAFLSEHTHTRENRGLQPDAT